jgi:uncharacterized membrane protein SpoIIM required for sporulation
MLPALVAFVLSSQAPEDGVRLMPGMEGVIEDIRARREWWDSLNDMGNGTGAGMIMTNNIQVCILVFAGGMTMGILSLYLLYNNGIMLGVVAGAAHALDFANNLWGFVAAHGTLELSMIFISGGAGLQLSWALLHPGLLTRRNALAVAARRAAVLMGLVVVLLVVAGMIEGFISPSSLPLWFKFGVSLVSGVLLYAYLLLAGRGARQAEQRPEALRIEPI